MFYLKARRVLHRSMTEPPLLQHEPTASHHHPRERLEQSLPSFPRLILGARLVETLDLLVAELEVARFEVVLKSVLLARGAMYATVVSSCFGEELGETIKKRT